MTTSGERPLGTVRPAASGVDHTEIAGPDLPFEVALTMKIYERLSDRRDTLEQNP